MEHAKTHEILDGLTYFLLNSYTNHPSNDFSCLRMDNKYNKSVITAMAEKNSITIHSLVMVDVINIDSSISYIFGSGNQGCN